jgi:hypothetical protein
MTLSVRPIVAVLCGLVLPMGVPTARAHAPGTDGGPAQRGCQPINGGTTYVGATKVSCSSRRQAG